jgi:hypothetical protein
MVVRWRTFGSSVLILFFSCIPPIYHRTRVVPCRDAPTQPCRATATAVRGAADAPPRRARAPRVAENSAAPGRRVRPPGKEKTHFLNLRSLTPLTMGIAPPPTMPRHRPPVPTMPRHHPSVPNLATSSPIRAHPCHVISPSSPPWPDEGVFEVPSLHKIARGQVTLHKTDNYTLK